MRTVFLMLLLALGAYEGRTVLVLAMLLLARAVMAGQDANWASD